MALQHAEEFTANINNTSEDVTLQGTEHPILSQTPSTSKLTLSIHTKYSLCDPCA